MKKNLVYIGVLLVLFILIFIGYLAYESNFGISKFLNAELIGDKIITLNYNDKYDDLGIRVYYKNKEVKCKIDINNNLDVTKIGEYLYTYIIQYKKQKKTINRTIKVIDAKEPILTLNGKNEETIYIGSSYEEKGASALDEYDGDVTDKIEITGNVDISKIGEYNISYIVKDSSNNQSVISRKVKVIEKPVVQNNYSSSVSYGIIGYTSKGYKIERKNGLVYINDILIANKSYALSSDYNPGDLLQVFKDNFYKMQSDALKEGLSLKIISGFRSYYYQSNLYNNYASRDGIALADTYSARPGHSEHQTGLAADVNSLSQDFEYTNEGKWLNNNCYKYGFIIRYVKNKDNITGYMFEPWHIRYVGIDLATKLYNNGNWITLEEYLGITSKY